MSGGAGRRRLVIPEQLRGLARLAKKQKWTIEYTGTGHLLWRSPSGREVVTSSTPGMRREKTIVKVRLRNAGLEIEG